jgi:O-antigen/teichoic acid export membrane protein
VLAPSLRVAAVGLVLASAGNVYLLAYAYVAGGAIGVAAYVAILVRTWRRQGLLSRLRTEGIELPTRELFGYSLPLLTSELMTVLKGSFVVVVLELLRDTTAVAEFRAILPVAKLNVVVFTSFSLLFIPVASSLFAKGDKESIHDLFWQTSTWIAVLSFPLLAATTTLAEPLTVLLFGERYASSANLLAVLAVGFYVNAALGANTATLRVFGRVKYLVATDLLVGATLIALYALTIPRYGAMGAAVATATALILHNVLHHVGLAGGTGVRLFEPAYARVYGVIVLALAGLTALDRLVSPPTYLSVAATAATSLAVLRAARPVLRAETTFPELLRARWVRKLIG